MFVQHDGDLRVLQRYQGVCGQKTRPYMSKGFPTRERVRMHSTSDFSGAYAQTHKAKGLVKLGSVRIHGDFTRIELFGWCEA